MMRLLRVAEAEPPVILRFTETAADTPREVLERAQAAVRKAIRGETGAISQAAAGGSTDGKGKRKSLDGSNGV